MVIDDKVVIKAGTQATGEVTASKKGGIVGIPGRIEIAVKYVEAVDKTSVPISGSKTVEGEDKLIAGIVLGVLCLPLIFVVRGGTPRISAGTMIDATVSMPTTITLK
ncbi:MAG: hypothetical protein HY805_01675 [Nitrospirae bacterium]|nr:hypothetical protein [Nitrospirota bacterium]